MNETRSAAVYGVKYFFRGRQIEDAFEPPSNFTEKFLDLLTDGLAHPGWNFQTQSYAKHNCEEACGLECCIVIGWPYTESVLEAVSAR